MKGLRSIQLMNLVLDALSYHWTFTSLCLTSYTIGVKQAEKSQEHTLSVDEGARMLREAANELGKKRIMKPPQLSSGSEETVISLMSSFLCKNTLPSKAYSPALPNPWDKIERSQGTDQ
ncbi:hypothetical protein INR49_012341 [Caranx melampygus]|nr:hypothetical protein INR49_012341 [Caranx melampygus]